MPLCITQLDFLILLWGHSFERENGVIIALIGGIEDMSHDNSRPLVTSPGNGSDCQIVLSCRIIIICSSKSELTDPSSSHIDNKSDDRDVS